ncbi:hypothetical protein ABI013_12400 [Enterococcus faecium]|uniref:hypothetical protein n=1 Tax=Enterococcus faecium TaxID=1352 RepID=UPI00145AB39C|nr:hypothetical protein [Enterococcus faecium]MBT1019220.1 hypothetical protein [Enterococcus faecium]MBT1039974.1 hypothetical protein [Enterococcus faecium]MBY3631689.1 hypothetical protein [Enterococcus faecium]MCE3157587.1 hypothetical protein [Enterococcus faecium]MCF8668990.1 hypothetical protein [Enterococcus faecium]
MGLSYVAISQEEVLGKCFNQKHVGSTGERDHRGNMKKVEWEIFQMNSEKMGEIEVRVAVGGAPKAMRYNAEVLLANPRISRRADVRNIGNDGETNKIARNRFYLLVDRVEVKGGNN